MEKMKLTNYVVEFMKSKGIEYVFLFQGGQISHLIDSIFNDNLRGGSLKPLCVMHEQAASMASDGYSRATGKIGVTAVSGGPGATNLVTGIACSYYDSIPGIYFTGQVRTWEHTGKSKQRQVGFQETDIVSIVKPLTKYAVMITNPQDIRYELEKAFWLAQSGRPGPVLIDLPMDVQWSEIEPEELRSYESAKEPPGDYKNMREKIRIVADWLRESKRPIIISGGGIRNACAINELSELATLGDIPVVATFNGIDTFAHDNSLYSGLIGTMGNGGTNACLNKSDLVLAIGARLALRQVKLKPKDFVPHGKLVHVDIDPNELNQRVPSDLALAYDAKKFLTLLLDELKANGCPRFTDWAKQTRSSFKETPFCKPEYYLEKNNVNPYVFMKTLSEQMADSDILVADAGHNLIWAMQTVEVRAQQRLFTAGAHSPMGYSLPAAIGVAACFSSGSPRAVCVIGDGGFQLNIQELQTIHTYNLPVKIFVLNNHCYGAIMDYQDANLGGRYYGTCPEYGYTAPDFLAIARAYKISTAEISSHDGLSGKIKSVLDTKGPILCNVNLGPRSQVALYL